MSSWRLPGSPLRARVLGVFAIAGGALTITAMAAQRALGLSQDFVWKADVIFVLIAGVGIGFVSAGHPFRRFGPANAVTTGRACLVALIAALVNEPGNGTRILAAGASMLAAVLDGVDGYLARRTRMASAFGARFDMETDALLILALSVLTWRGGKAGAWILLAGLLRYLFVAATWIVPRLRRPLLYSRRRQVVCVVQIAGLSLAILPRIVPPHSVWLAAALLAILVYSFAVDIIWLCRRSQPHLERATA
jgi:phosphatidylglycerophosphate synthase